MKDKARYNVAIFPKNIAKHVRTCGTVSLMDGLAPSHLLDVPPYLWWAPVRSGDGAPIPIYLTSHCTCSGHRSRSGDGEPIPMYLTSHRACGGHRFPSSDGVPIPMYLTSHRNCGGHRFRSGDGYQSPYLSLPESFIMRSPLSGLS